MLSFALTSSLVLSFALIRSARALVCSKPSMYYVSLSIHGYIDNRNDEAGDIRPLLDRPRLLLTPSRFNLLSFTLLSVHRYNHEVTNPDRYADLLLNFITGACGPAPPHPIEQPIEKPVETYVEKPVEKPIEKPIDACSKPSSHAPAPPPHPARIRHFARPFCA